MGLRFNREDAQLGSIPAVMPTTSTSTTPAPTGLPNRAYDWGMLAPGTAGQVLAANADGSIGWSSTATISVTGNANTPLLVVAASDAPAWVKASTNYVCTGVNDEAVINAAIAAACLAYPEGGEVKLSQGSFYCRNQITVRPGCTIRGEGVYGTNIYMSVSGTRMYGMAVTGIGTVTLQSGGSGYGVGDIIQVTGGGGTGATIQVVTLSTTAIATFLIMSSGTGYAITSAAATAKLTGSGSAATFNITALCNQDLFSQPYNANALINFAEFFIDGCRLASSNAILGCLDQITGIVPQAVGQTGNTDANGALYVNLIHDNSSNHHIDIYSSLADATNQVTANRVAYSGTLTDASAPLLSGTLTALNTSGIGGQLGVMTVPTASADYIGIVLSGNTKGAAFNINQKDLHCYNLMIMNAAGAGIIDWNAWGCVLDNCIVEFCGGVGVNLAGGTFGKIINLKSRDNNGHGLSCAANNCMVSNSEFNSGNQNDLNLNPTGTAGVYVSGTGNSFANIQSTAVKASCYGFWVVGNRTMLIDCIAIPNLSLTGQRDRVLRA